MVIAYLLVNLEVHEEKINILDTLQDIPEIIYSYQVYGTYDIIMLIEADNIKVLRDIILKSIRRLQYVHSTMTLLSMDSYDNIS